VPGDENRGPAQYAAFAGMCLIWGTTFLAIRVGNEAVPPLWAAFIRLALATVLNLLVALATRAVWPRGAALQGIVQFGLLNLGINFALLYWGEQRVPSGVAAVFYATVPLTTAVFAAMMGVQRLEPLKMAAAAIGLGGVTLIFSGELRQGAPAPALIAVFTAATCASLSAVILKRVPPHSTFVVNGIGAAAGSCVCLAGSFLLGESHALPRTAASWFPILYLTIAGSLGAFVFWAWLVTQWRITSVTVGALIIPVIAVVVGAIAKGESPAPETYLGAILVLFGVSVSLFGDRWIPALRQDRK
jgi:drug/metabolite transporter (DMT)-like permease